MLTSQVVKMLQDVMSRRGDRRFAVHILVDGRPVCEVPAVNIVARTPKTGGSTGVLHINGAGREELLSGGTIGFDILLVNDKKITITLGE